MEEIAAINVLNKLSFLINSVPKSTNHIISASHHSFAFTGWLESLRRDLTAIYHKWCIFVNIKLNRYFSANWSEIPVFLLLVDEFMFQSSRFSSILGYFLGDQFAERRSLLQFLLSEVTNASFTVNLLNIFTLILVNHIGIIRVSHFWILNIIRCCIILLRCMDILVKVSFVQIVLLDLLQDHFVPQVPRRSFIPWQLLICRFYLRQRLQSTPRRQFALIKHKIVVVLGLIIWNTRNLKWTLVHSWSCSTISHSCIVLRRLLKLS